MKFRGKQVLLMIYEMKRDASVPYKFNSLSDLHRMLGLPQPLHPLISLIDNNDNTLDSTGLPSFLSGKLKYGQHYYDFDEGGLFLSLRTS